MLTNMKHTGNHLDTGNYSSECGHPSDIVIITLPQSRQFPQLTTQHHLTTNVYDHKHHARVNIVHKGSVSALTVYKHTVCSYAFSFDRQLSCL